MIKGIILAITILTSSSQTDNFIGIAENQHYISNSVQQVGYYIENDLDIHKDDTVLIVDGEVYVVDCTHK